MSKHTPGKWEWDEPSNWHGTAARIMVGEPYGMIAQVNIAGWKPRGMAIANARLIAAAPDLLASCQAIEHLLTNGTVHIGTVAGASFPDVFASLRAAIAKATGEQ